MQRFLSILFISFALIVSAAGAAPAAHAQSLPEGNACPQGSYWIEANKQCEYGDYSPAALVTENEAAAQETAATAARIAGDKAAQLTAVDAGNTPKLDGAMAQIMSFIMSLFAWLLGVAMLTLNYAVYYTVVTMGDYVHNLAAVGIAWKILRDIGNIMLIFGFLAVGITTILSVDWYGGGKKMLPMMLVAAVFLNFSLFISEAIIDTGNLFATQFYTQINGGTFNESTVSNTTIKNEGVSNKIMQQLGLATMYTGALTNSNMLAANNSMLVGFMGILVFIIAAFVMFSLAFILIFRFIALLFLIILSPVGFAGLAVPGLEARMRNYWSKLFEQTITAPILLLMLYIALAIITDVHFLAFGPKGDWAGFIPNTDGSTNFAGFASVILSFLVAMGLLIAVVIQSKNLSAFGAKLASRAAGKLSFGAVSLGGRATLGLAGGYLASKRMQARARRGGAAGLALKGLVLGGKGLRGATYDFRNLPGAVAGAGAINVTPGKGATITAKQAIESFDTQYGLKPIRKFFEESAQEREQAGREMEFKDAQTKIEEINTRYGTGELTSEQKIARKTDLEPHEKTIATNLAKMSTKQLEELGGIKKGVESLVTNLSPQQFDALMKSDKVNETEKGNIRRERFKELTTIIGDATAAAAAAAAPGATQVQKDEAEKTEKTARDRITQVNLKELSYLDKDLLVSDLVADSLTNDQADSLSKEGVLGTAQKITLDARRKDRFDPTKVAPTAVAAALRSTKWNRDQINKLPAATLTDKGVLDALGADALTLADIVRRGNMSPLDKRKIGTYLQEVANSTTDPTRAEEFKRYIDFDLRILRDLNSGPGGGAGTGGRTQPPPAGFQQNPGGVILTPKP